MGNPELHANSGNISGIERGDTRDIAAAKAGLGSGKTMEAAQKVVEHGAPELVEAIGPSSRARSAVFHHWWRSDNARPVLARAAQKVVERGIPELVGAMDTKKPARWPAFACVLVGDTGIEPVTSTV